MRPHIFLRHQKLLSRCFSRYFSSISSQNNGTVQLSYNEYGDGSETKGPLVMVHGLFGNKQNFTSLAKRLSSDGRKVLTVCCRNHGESGQSSDMDYHLMAKDLENLLDDLKLKDVILLGHSMGGKLVMTSALTHPERLKGLVVVDVTPAISPSGHLESYARKMREIPLRKNLSLSRARLEVDSQLQSTVQDKIVRNFLLTNLVENSNGDVEWRINLDSIISNFNKILGFPTDIHDVTFDKPSLFIGGTRSPQISGNTIPKIKEFFPTCDIELIEGAGHWVHSEKSNQFLQIVKNFLDQKNL
ncbi:hypothetical protein LOTGIDRAFT_203749 [Lottia gigantea]|uniref:sn-1-specific diacylglycerol lipase ABHD11 n=1 Tax=Lottia gigantea TaxID=225164 RepID=V4ARD8_LOTGI|nr:hypothetical protein LOTGIDRAFT_203749 [Lottia gigantea]ESO97360.1 hypothetical protein LOTGIDRAFT_203749 [Lottia gigantea]